MSISRGVMKLDEFPDCVFYRVACGCSDGGHNMEIWMEHEKDSSIIWLRFYADVEWCWWHDGFWEWFVRRWKLFKASLRLFFVGYIEMNQEFTLQNPEHIDAFIEALEEGKAHCLKAKEEYEKKGIYN